MYTPDSEIRIRLLRSRRKTLALQIEKDGTVLVRAPYLFPEHEIMGFVEKHRDWIAEHRSRVLAQAEERKNTVHLTEQELQDLAGAAGKDLPRRAAHFASVIGVSYGRITIRNQKTKWGSCSSRGNLNFNCLLMLAPEYVRDYVVVHELCHRKQMNHSPAFWEEVEKVLPDYRNAKKWLRQHGSELIAMNPVL